MLEAARSDGALAEAMAAEERVPAVAGEATGALVDRLEVIATGAEKARDAVRAFVAELIQLVARRAFLEPLATDLANPPTRAVVTVAPTAGQSAGGSFLGALGSAFVSGVGKLFGFAEGGVTGGLPVPAGVHAKPYLAVVGEGALPEAVVPLQDRRTVPVSLAVAAGRLAAAVELPGGRALPASVRLDPAATAVLGARRAHAGRGRYFPRTGPGPIGPVRANFRA